MSALELSAQRLALSPGTRLLWRAPDVVQLELGSDAVVVDGATAETVRALIESPAADRSGISPAEIAPDALRVLLDAGFVRPCGFTQPDPRDVPPVPRLAADLLALSTRYGTQASAVLTARRTRRVSVEGTSRVATAIAALLAAAGVGHVYLAASADVRLHQAMPGGLTPTDEGRRFAESSGDAVRRAAPDVDLTPLAMGEYPDLVVLAGELPLDPDRRDALHAARCAHLSVHLGVDGGSVGPLVVPGETSCLACADLHRRERDAAWPALAVQLTVRPRRGPGSDVVLASRLAGLVAQQALEYLDESHADAVENASLEVRADEWQVRRRSRHPHADCACGAATTAPHAQPASVPPSSPPLGTMFG